MTGTLNAAAALAAVGEAKAFLRVSHETEEAILPDLVGSSAGLCEAFTRQALVVGPRNEIVPASAAWQRLAVTPVRAITGVESLPTEGPATALSAEAYAIDIDASGDGWVRIVQPAAAKRVRVSYEAGMADSWADLPEALRHGILRLTAHLYTHRDAPGSKSASEPPAAVSALWRPWRRMRLA